MRGLLRRLQPRSIFGLVLLAFALVTAPLVAAIIAASAQVENLADQSRTAVVEAELATRHSRALLEQLTEMERSFGQFQVLLDDALYDDYLARRSNFRYAASALAALAPDPALLADIQALIDEEHAVFDRLTGKQRRVANVDGLAEEFAPLAERAHSILARSRERIEREANRTITAAGEIKRTMFVQALAVIPVAMTLTALFAILITRPIWHLDRAIRRLGRGDFVRPIEVQGPRDLRELGVALDWLRRRIVVLEAQKIEFLRHVTHELKSPLASIREGTELLLDRDGGDAGEARQITEIMRDSGLRLQKLIENLLHFARDANPEQSSPMAAQLALRPLVEQVLKEHGLALAARGISVDKELDDAGIPGNEQQLRIVIDNLLSNAIKFSPDAGSIRISLRKQGDNVLLSVQDSGPGILPDERVRVFEPFFQGRNVPQSIVRGSGLGLAIAGDYVERHGGRIEIVPSGSGAHFSVQLPAGTGLRDRRGAGDAG